MKVFAKNIVLAATVLTNNVIAEEAANPFKEADEKETFEEANHGEERLLTVGQRIRSTVKKAKIFSRAIGSLSARAQKSQKASMIAMVVATTTKPKSPYRQLRGGRQLQTDEERAAACDANLNDDDGCDVACVYDPVDSGTCDTYETNMLAEISSYGYTSTVHKGFNGSICSIKYTIPAAPSTADEQFAISGLNEMDRCLPRRQRRLSETMTEEEKRRMQADINEDAALVKVTEYGLHLYYTMGADVRRRQLDEEQKDGGAERQLGTTVGVVYGASVTTRSSSGECVASADVATYAGFPCSANAGNYDCIGTPGRDDGGHFCSIRCELTDGADIASMKYLGFCVDS